MPYIRVIIKDGRGGQKHLVAHSYRQAVSIGDLIPPHWPVRDVYPHTQFEQPIPATYFDADHRRLIDVGDGLQYADTGKYYTRGQRVVWRIMDAANVMLAAYYTKRACEKAMGQLTKANPLLAAACRIERYEPLGDDVCRPQPLDPKLLAEQETQ